MLDLHDVCAETAEDLRARGPGERRRQIDDADAGERREAHRRESSRASPVRIAAWQRCERTTEAGHEHAALVDRRDRARARRDLRTAARDRLRRASRSRSSTARSTSTAVSAGGSKSWGSRRSASAPAPRRTARSAQTPRCGPAAWRRPRRPSMRARRSAPTRSAGRSRRRSASSAAPGRPVRSASGRSRACGQPPSTQRPET